MVAGQGPPSEQGGCRQGGSQVNKPNSINEIAKQVIWGNKFIKFRGKFIHYKNWIDSDIIYIKDIVDHSGKINESCIYDKLKDKTNWIAEITVLKKSIPSSWTKTLKMAALICCN